MAEFKLGRLKLVWKGTWTAATTYVKDDIVRNGGKTYICVNGHNSSATFFTDLTNPITRWNQLSDGSEWKGPWAVGIDYKLNDVVKYGGLLYLCNEGHQSAGTTLQGLELDQSKWDLYAEGYDFKGDWTTNFRYKKSDVVKFGGNTYVCNTHHSSTGDGLEVDIAKWDLYSEGMVWQDTWQTDFRYLKNDVVRYGGQTYRCNQGHTSAATETLGLEADQSKWDYVHKGFEFKNDWDGNNVRYKVNDLVKFGADLWICITHHTSSTTFDESKWLIFVNGLQFEDSWSDSTIYQPGDVATYGGYSYIAKTNNTNKTPSTNATDWALYTTGFNFRQDWVNTTSYKVGDVVRVDGYTYLAVLDSTPIVETATESVLTTNRITIGDTTGIVSGMTVVFTGTVFGGVVLNDTYYVKTVDSGTEITISKLSGGVTFAPSNATGSMTVTISQRPPNTTYWEKLNEGIKWKGNWTTGEDYVLGDVTFYDSNSYICVLSHTGETGVNRPDGDTLGTYWNLLAAGSEESVLTTKGDMVYHGGAGPTRLPIGKDGQVLKVIGNTPGWAYFGVINHIYYVADNGVDAPSPNWGVTLDKPWRTIRYATQQIENGAIFPNTTTLLKNNREFIAAEAVEWTDYQIANNITPFTSSFVYDKEVARRDVNSVINAVIWDLSHGGNRKSRELIYRYFNDATSYISGEKIEANATINYAKTVVESVIQNLEPIVNFQTENSVASPVLQRFDATLTTELYVQDIISNLMAITTDAILANTLANVPALVRANKTIVVKTGTFLETLPIIVPEDTAVVGDELRSTVISPAGQLIPSGDYPTTTEALGYVKSITDNIVTNTPISTIYSSLTQNTSLPTAQDGTSITDYLNAYNELGTLTNNIYNILDTNASVSIVNNLPAGADSGYTNAAALLTSNTAFVKAEIVQYLDDNYDELWNTTLSAAQRTACQRDVGYLIEALVYDLIYGGNSASVDAAKAYYVGTQLQIAAGEKVATLAAYGQLKTIVQALANGGSYTPLQIVEARVLGTAGSNAASTTVGLLMDDITTTINNINSVPTITYPDYSFAPATYQKIFDDLILEKYSIQSEVLQRVNYKFPDLDYNQTTCSRDVGLMIDAVSIDLVLDSNYRSIVAGRAYRRATASALIVLNNQKEATLDAISLMRYMVIKIAEGPVKAVNDLWQNVIDYLNTNTKPTVTGSNLVTQNSSRLKAADLMAANKEFLVAEAIGYIGDNYFVYDSAKCSRDLGLIIDAVGYDMAIGTNYNSVIAGSAYRRAMSSLVITDQLTETLGGINHAAGLSATAVTGNATAVSRVNAGFAEIVDIIQNGLANADALTFPTLSGVTANQEKAKDILIANKDFLKAEVVAYVESVYPSPGFTFNATTCARDVGYIVDALCYDIMYGGNSAVSEAAEAYYNGTVSQVAGQEVQTAAALNYMASLMTNLMTNTAISPTYQIVEAQDVSQPASVGSIGNNLSTLVQVISNTITYGLSSLAARQFPDLTGLGVPNTEITSRSALMTAKSTIQYDTIAWIDTTYNAYTFNVELCSRDIREYVDAIVYDLMYPGNYKSVLAGTYYQNAKDGSITKDMFYVRNGTGLRNCTLSGLTGTLSAANSYGTQRPTAGAYVSLDPGYGTNDRNVWITTRSPYVQNVTTFGTACIGQKIDGSLHDGGNDSIVSNDFTQVLSDGIGAWVTNLGRAELVSVFTYYNHIGYLAENGGKIRATNGNNSYGKFGSVSEGVNNTEIAITGTVNNRAYEAQIGEVFTDTVDKVLAFEYTNAGQNYTSSTFTVTGDGYNIAVGNSEFRDGAIYEVRVLDPLDNGGGGTGYVTAQNNALTGNSTSLTLSPTDLASSTAYVGMRLIIIAGKGTGQYGYIQAYNSGTKVASIYKESTGTAGWDHIVPGTPFVNPDVTSKYLIEPRISFTAPTFGTSSRTIGSGTYNDVAFGNATFVAVSTGTGTETSINGTSWTSAGTLTSGTWTSVVYGGGKFVTVANGSNNAAYSSDNGASWTGTSLPGAPSNWSSVASDGTTFLAISSNSTTAAYSADGTSWSSVAGTLPSTGFSSITYGQGKWVAVASGGTVAAYSINNGTTWVETALPSSASWSKVKFGNNRFVAIATGSTTASAFSLDGITWYASTMPATANWTALGYGQGVFVAASQGTDGATSQDGINWTARTLTSSNWSGIAFGNPTVSTVISPVFVGVSSTSGTTALSVNAGAIPFIRCTVTSNKISEFRVIEPGSGYTSAPTVTITDPNNTADVVTEVRWGYGVNATPTFNNRGIGYINAQATMTGNGYADIYQTLAYINGSGFTEIPLAGSNVQLAGDPTFYKLVSVTEVLGSSAPYTARLQLSPKLGILRSPAHGTSFEIRILYSQVRLTGHDFLDIGTGNLIDTNYPGIPVNQPDPDNETVEGGGGRVFYTSTDQDGNFRVGSLFTVEQATGTATLNADAFNLAGLQELQLGGVGLGGGGAIVNEFSTDGTFAANSDKIVPTQKAIRTYIASQIGGGGSTLNVNTITAGVIEISGQQITTTTGEQINVLKKMNFTGGIDGSPVALNFYLLS